MSEKLGKGTVFAGRYRVVRCIASGGMGAVYEVVHLETDRRRALKIMHPHLFQSEEMRERFKREARIAAQVDSEYIVDVSDAGVDEATQTPFLVMELLRGEELGERLKRLKRFPPEEVVMYMQQTAWALDRTHAASIVHRDLKPANLFLTIREDGTPRIKILDFGVAKLVAEGATAAGATRSLGTPLYMAPEQFRANTKLTAAADIHALTLMTYTLLVGKAYWSEEAKSTGDVIAFAMLVVNGPQESAVQRAARHGVVLPPGFEPWFAKGTAVNPTDRFATATEAVRALREVGGPASTGVAPPPLRLVPASGMEMFAPENRPAIPSIATLDPAATSTGASAITTALPAKRSRAPLVAGVAALGLLVIGLAGWLTLRTGASVPPLSAAQEVTSTTPAAISAVPAASSPAPVEAAAPTVAATAVPSPSAGPVAAPSTTVAPAPTTRAGGTRTLTKPTVPLSPPKSSLLGPD